MDPEWKPPSAAAAEVIRSALGQIIDLPEAWLDEYNAAALSAVRLDELADDSAAINALRGANEANLRHWVLFNLEVPGGRVPVRVVENEAEMVREMTRRGLDAGMLDAFRTAQAVAWRRWMETCFSVCDDVAILAEVLETTSRSITTFIDDTVRALAEQIRVARAQLAGDTHAERRAAVALILEGAPITQARAEAQLHYRLSGPQIAVVLSGLGASMSQLEAVCDSLMTVNAIATRLTVLAGADRLWVWFPTATLDCSAVPDGAVRVSVGQAGEGREGFRRSHFQALGADRTAIRLGSSRTVVRYDDLALIGAMSDDPSVVDRFVAQTLGDLVSADPELRECLRVWFAERCNSTSTAARLYTHRNTVVRRVARASEMLPIPLERNAVAVSAALEVLHWRE